MATTEDITAGAAAAAARNFMRDEALAQRADAAPLTARANGHADSMTYAGGSTAAPLGVPSAPATPPPPVAARPSAAARFGRWLLAVVVIVGAGALVLLGGKGGLISNFTFLQMSLVLIYAIAVLGLNLLTGFNGQISLGHGAFFALGAYTAAIMIDHFDIPYWLTFPAAAVACFVAGYLFGLPALRLEGHYLALATFALATAVPQILKYRHFEAFTGGVQGINLIKPDAPFGLALSGDQWMYLVVLAMAVLMFWLASNLLESRMGRAMMAIRDQPLAASAMGINLARVKAVTFGISAVYVGIAGALHAIIFEYVSPDSFPFDLSVAILVGLVVGGVASLPGALIGGAFVQVIDKYSDALTKQLTAAVHLPIDLEPWTIYGIVLITLVYLMPGGVAGALRGLFIRLRRT